MALTHTRHTVCLCVCLCVCVCVCLWCVMLVCVYLRGKALVRDFVTSVQEEKHNGSPCAHQARDSLRNSLSLVSREYAPDIGIYYRLCYRRYWPST